MSDVVIRAEGLGKYYRLGQRERYHTLRDTLMDALRAPFTRRTPAAPDASSRYKGDGFWALRDVSFEIRRGDVVGVIGRNGAGKSTLLKLLSRITEPTLGRAELHGRVGSLLEVGTGFHPELSGRENIFLNGAIIGMRRAEIARHFDEIVAFAEVEPFIDTPIKRYSSGMYLRLAFAVAAHLNPEILFVDEVLAVGDAAFQKKCIGKMSEVASTGRTILFVSHNLGAVANLCTRGLLLSQGQLVGDLPVRDAIAQYIDLGNTDEGERRWDADDAPGSSNVRLRSVRVLSKGTVTSDVSVDVPFEVEITFETLVEGLELSTGLHITHAVGGDVLAANNFPSAMLGHDPFAGRAYPRGEFSATCTVPANLLNEGVYGLNVVLMQRYKHLEVLVRDVVQINVFDEGGMRKEYGGIWIGLVRPRLAWTTEQVGAGR